MQCKKGKNKERVKASIGYTLWGIQTLTTSIAVGAFASLKIADAKDDNIKNSMIAAMITALIIIILIVAAAKWLIGSSKTIEKIGANFLLLLLVVSMFLVIASVMKIGGDGKFKFGLALAGCIGFFVLDANLIMNGNYERKPKGNNKKAEIPPDDFIYASMKLFMDFILIFVMLVQMMSSD